MSSRAGPSTQRRDRRAVSSDEEDDTLPELQESSTLRTRRKRLSEMSIEEIFEDTTPEAKKVQTQAFRHLQTEVHDLHSDLPNTTVDVLAEKIRESSKLFRDVKDTGLAAQDAKVLVTAGEAALALARKMRLDSNVFNVDEFLIRTKGILGLDRMADDIDELESDDSDVETARRPRRKGPMGDWEKVGWMAAGLCRRVMGVEFMNGPIETVAKRRKLGQRQRRREVAPEIRPTEILTQPKQTEEDAMKDTMAMVKRVHKVLRRADTNGKGINFFELVINPDDFGQSVENCFYVSFLIHQGAAGIEVRPDGMVIVSVREPSDPEAGDEEIPRHQAVIQLSMDTWERAKRLFDITESMIPHRSYQTQGLAGNAWYA